MSLSQLTSLINKYPEISLVAGIALLIVLAGVVVIVAGAKKRKARKAEPPAPYSYQDLAEELKKADGLSALLKDRCRSFGVDYLAGFVELLPGLTGNTAAQLQALALEEKWLRQYVENIIKNKEYSLELLTKAWRIMPDKEVLPQLVELLADKDEGVRMAGVDIIAAIKDRGVLPYLVAALLQPQIYLPARVAEALAAFGAVAARLLAEILPTLAPGDKLIVIDALSQLPFDYPLTNVLACLYDDDLTLRARTAAALGEAERHEGAEALLKASKDEEWQVRSAAIKSLGQLAYRPALVRALALMNDEAFAVRANAGEAWKTLSALQEKQQNGETADERNS